MPCLGALAVSDLDAGRRSVILGGLGASALAGFGESSPAYAAENSLQGTVSPMLPSVGDFGAIGNGVADDAMAFQRALGGNAGGTIIVPFLHAGYRLAAPVTVPPGTVLWFLGEGQQQVSRDHDGDLFILQSGARIVGGDFRGGRRGGEGACFRFEQGTGQQSLERIRATRGWTAPILRYHGDGGSQSRVVGFSLSCDPGPSRPFAVAMEAGSGRNAAPRHFQAGEFNGAPSFDFDGCSVVSINGVYCGALRFTDTSRAVMMSDTRVGNQVALEIRGSDHILIAGWHPRLTLASGADNCLISGFFNSGYVWDVSGNGRNLVEYWPHQVTPALISGAQRLSPGQPYQAAISRSGATYTFRFGFQLDMREIGTGGLELELPDGVSTSAATDQWGAGMLQVYGSPLWETLALRVLPKGERHAIALIANGRPLSERPGLARISGSVSFSA